MTREREIWQRYIEAAGSLVELIDDAPVVLDELTKAEGLRHLTRALHMGMISVHDYADVDAPHVFLAKTPALLTGGTTSDCIYHEVFFDGARPYRITATRGTAPLLEMTANAGRIGIDDRADMVDSIREDTLVLDGDGELFDVVLSPHPKPDGFDGNWLWTDNPDRGRATWMLIRQYSTAIDDVEPAHFDIAPIDESAPRPPLTLERIDAALADSVAFADRLVRHWTAMTAGMIQGLTNNFLVVDDIRAASEAMPTGHRFATAGFHLAPDEAWIVTIQGIGAPPYDRAPYWGFQLCNYWFEPLDYGDAWAHRNKATTTTDPDGAARIVVSERRPPPPHDRNWVQLRGHTLGNAQFRLSRIGDPLPPISCEVLPIDQLS
ncbi:MAG: DUF1214 domain-containing protein [Acidimicrobiia bacterium]|nr:DUF1214 domain-containing protein [Acidimicrobiia bacterium]